MSSPTAGALADAPVADASAPAAHPMKPSSSTVSMVSEASASSSPLPTPVWSAESSRRNSQYSLESVPMSVSASADSLPAKSGLPPPSPRTKATHTTDPLLRTYPKPEHDINVREALQREPLRWTLGYWTKNARDVQAAPTSSAAGALERQKQELRRYQQDLDQVVPRRR